MWHCFIDGLTDTRIDMDLVKVGVDLRLIVLTLDLISGLDRDELDLGLRSRRKLG